MPSSYAGIDSESYRCRQESAATQTDSRVRALKWWADFRQCSFIHINDSADPKNEGFQIARNYALVRYMLACNACGRYPTRFNGEPITTDPAM